MADTHPTAASTGETPLFDVSPSMFYRHPFWFIIVFILCFVLIGLIIFWIWHLRTRGTRVIVTDRRVILRTGLVSVTTDEVRHADITNMVVHQGLFQRLGGVGDLKLSTSAESDFEIVVRGLPKIHEIADTIRRYQR